MQPYEITLKKMVRRGGKIVPAGSDMTADEQTWTGMMAFVPGDVETIRKKVAAVKTSYPANVFPADGGALVHAGHSDLEKVVKALQKG
jgi:hypothetical protein